MWAVADQAAFTLSHFVLNVFLARWLPAEEYGAFAVAYSAFLLLGSIHSGFLSEPIVILGSGKYSGDMKMYLGSVIYAHLGFSVVTSSLLVLAAVLLSLPSELMTLAVALSLSAPLILLQWLARHACYAASVPRLAAFGGAAYMGLIVSGAAALQALNWLSAASAIAVMAMASLVVSTSLWASLGVSWPGPSRRSLMATALRDHWHYGRWAIPARVLAYVPGNLYFFLLPVWVGLGASGTLRALMNTLMPILQGYAALSTLLTGALSRPKEAGRFNNLVVLSLRLFIGSAIAYWILLVIANRAVLDLFYGGQYGDAAPLLSLLGLVPIGVAITSVVGAALRASFRPDRVFWAYLAGACWALAIGTIATAVWGISGSIVALVGGSAVTAVAMSTLYRRAGKRTDGPDSEKKSS